MSFTLCSTSTSFINKNERLKRKRLTTTTLNRFSSFNENKSSSVDNRRRLFQSTPNLIELLEEDEDDIDDNQGLCHECNICSKLFASEYGFNHHINMYHPNQSVLCSHCQITFRSHRSLKTHQQRPFSSEQFPLIAKNACEQQRLPLGYLSSKIYQCHLCLISFPCSRTLKYHLLNKHEQYEYKNCQKILSDLILQVEFNLRTVNNNNSDDDIETIKFILSKQASQFGLIDKQLSKKLRSIKIEQNRFIYSKCQHINRTCANLCLENVSSYSKLIENYSFTIPILPKGNAFSQGSIVSIISSTNNIYSNDLLSTNDLNSSNDLLNTRQKRKNIKHTNNSISSSPVKKKILSNVTIINSKTNRINSNNKLNIKQQIEQITKTNEIKSFPLEQSSFTLAITPVSSSPRKILPKDNYMRSLSSMSSNSSTSTRSLTTKSSSSSINLTQQPTISSQRTSKRNLSPSVTISLEKRHQTRKQKQIIASSSTSSTAIIRIDDG
ncbi:unnamed protein product, partial [Rotaria sordida]